MHHVSGFLGYIKNEKRYSIHTVQAYQRDLEQFFLYLKSSYELEQLEQIGHLHIRSWLASLKEQSLQSKSINRKISTLKSFYQYLMRNGILTQSPMGKIISPKNAKRLPNFVNESNMERLLLQELFSDDIKGLTDQLIVELLYQTGMRRAELLGLSLASIDDSQCTIKVLGKGNKERILPIAETLLELIKTYRKERLKLAPQHDYLLVLENGKRLYPKYVYLVVHRYLAMGTTLDKKSPHVLRHTFATHLLNKGADLNAVKELLGHASLAATQVYTHNTIDKLKEIHKKAHPKA